MNSSLDKAERIMEISHHSKLFDVLEAYPQLEAQIINIAPPFKNLKNPILRRTVGKIATLAQVAQVGGMDANKLVNTLRTAVGQQELGVQGETAVQINFSHTPEDPDWIAGEPQFTVDGMQLLARGEVPLGKVNQLLVLLETDRYILLSTNFEPTPILDAMRKQNRRVFQKTVTGDTIQYLTFIG
jgi:hypothetical protein